MKIKIYSVIALFVIVLTACQNNQSLDNSSSSHSKINRNQRVEQITHQDNEKNNKEFPSSIADRLVKLALTDPNVQDATAVVIGKYAVVGIDVPKKLDASRVGTIKYSVAQAIKKDPMGARAIITADADLYERLRNMATSIKEGHPVAGITDQLAEIVSRIIPQVPKRVEERDLPKPNPPMNIKTH